MQQFVEWLALNITWIMNFLAVVALGMSVYQLRAAARQASSLKHIGDSLTTRYIGQFPDFYENILEILSTSKESVKTIYDLPAYACFSRTLDWLSFEHRLAMLAQQNVRITIAFYSAERRRKMLREQFSYNSNQEWILWSSKRDIADRLENFQKRYGQKKKPISNVGQFLSLLDETHDDTAKKFVELYDAIELPSLIPLYAWVVDEKVAIFVIPSYTKEHSEYGFISNDARVVAALSTMIDRVISQHRDD